MVTVNGMSGGSMLRVLGAARKRDVKATKNLSIIVLFFIVCWFPLYTINSVQAFCPECEVSEAVLNSCIILSHLNSAGNPLLYAYHLTDFRAALRALLLGQPSVSGRDNSAYIHDHPSERQKPASYRSRGLYSLPGPCPTLVQRKSPPESVPQDCGVRSPERLPPAALADASSRSSEDSNLDDPCRGSIYGLGLIREESSPSSFQSTEAIVDPLKFVNTILLEPT
ncbi:hypothetical protein AAG570_000384 [Ranatra chinensis]|uniref:G-protein coupled receptors family 1 profile domain-containing protein n=1 Tax=Ranatra chinensis TaxID=642074 RepID=A0ABD0Z9L0_9HEMI